MKFYSELYLRTDYGCFLQQHHWEMLWSKSKSFTLWSSAAKVCWPCSRTSALVRIYLPPLCPYQKLGLYLSSYGFLKMPSKYQLWQLSWSLLVTIKNCQDHHQYLGFQTLKPTTNTSGASEATISKVLLLGLILKRNLRIFISSKFQGLHLKSFGVFRSTSFLRS